MKLKDIKSDVKEVSSDRIFYHGTKVLFSEFDPKKSAVGHAQEGPGFYFTSSMEDALHYTEGASKIVLKVKLSLGKPLVKTTKTQLSKLEFLIKRAPNYKEQILDNWGENFFSAYSNAINAYSDYEFAHDCYTTIWNDFYSDAPDKWLNVMVRMGYDCFIPETKKNIDGKKLMHVIMYDASKIRILETIRQ
jgi:hypothetical protein